MLWQAICGDQTDGYPGCPGSGPGAADKLLEGIGWESYVPTFKSGPRKGMEEVRWKEAEMDRWSAIVSAYRKDGLKESDAVVQINLARILQHSDRKSGGSGKSVSVRVDLGGRSHIKKKKQKI